MIHETETSDFKQAVVVRKDLNMRKGKMIAQGAHASMAALLSRSKRAGNILSIDLNDPDVGPWLLGRFKKIALGVDSEEALIALHEKALAAGLPCALITDSGLTEFNGVPTKTSCAIGPADPAKIDAICKELKLL